MRCTSSWLMWLAERRWQSVGFYGFKVGRFYVGVLSFKREAQ
jgi:hypothetical protein